MFYAKKGTYLSPVRFQFTLGETATTEELYDLIAIEDVFCVEQVDNQVYVHIDTPVAISKKDKVKYVKSLHPLFDRVDDILIVFVEKYTPESSELLLKCGIKTNFLSKG